MSSFSLILPIPFILTLVKLENRTHELLNDTIFYSNICEKYQQNK